MTFEEWMGTQELSEKSIKNYSHAIRVTISNWAISAGLITNRLNTIRDPESFKSLYHSIRTLPTFSTMNGRGKGMYAAAISRYFEYLLASSEKVEQPSPIVAEIKSFIGSDEIISTERLSLVNARVGQGKFREQLLLYWGRCAVTGYAAASSMLVASHIKPWSVSSNEERLNPFNGLLLVPNIDRAFDQGLISFDASGQIMISKYLINPTMFGITPEKKIELTPNHEPFMAYHRTHRFIAE